jgi:hypothetical protein
MACSRCLWCHRHRQTERCRSAGLAHISNCSVGRPATAWACSLANSTTRRVRRANAAAICGGRSTIMRHLQNVLRRRHRASRSSHPLNWQILQVADVPPVTAVGLQSTCGIKPRSDRHGADDPIHIHPFGTRNSNVWPVSVCFHPPSAHGSGNQGKPVNRPARIRWIKTNRN